MGQRLRRPRIEATYGKKQFSMDPDKLTDPDNFDYYGLFGTGARPEPPSMYPSDIEGWLFILFALSVVISAWLTVVWLAVKLWRNLTR